MDAQLAALLTDDRIRDAFGTNCNMDPAKFRRKLLDSLVAHSPAFEGSDCTSVSMQNEGEGRMSIHLHIIVDDSALHVWGRFDWWKERVRGKIEGCRPVDREPPGATLSWGELADLLNVTTNRDFMLLGRFTDESNRGWPSVRRSIRAGDALLGGYLHLPPTFIPVLRMPDGDALCMVIAPERGAPIEYAVAFHDSLGWEVVASTLVDGVIVCGVQVGGEVGANWLHWAEVSLEADCQFDGLVREATDTESALQSWRQRIRVDGPMALTSADWRDSTLSDSPRVRRSPWFLSVWARALFDKGDRKGAVAMARNALAVSKFAGPDEVSALSVLASCGEGVPEGVEGAAEYASGLRDQALVDHLWLRADRHTHEGALGLAYDCGMRACYCVGRRDRPSPGELKRLLGLAVAAGYRAAAVVLKARIDQL